MSASIRQLLDGDNELVYPVTSASCTYTTDGKYTVQMALDRLQDENVSIAFKSDGQIEKTFDNGDKVTTTFNADNTIKEVTVNSDNKVLKTKTITFKADGGIDIEVE